MVMSTLPEFPRFKPIEIEDYGIFGPILHQYQPETSEWTFTNLFIWRSHYNFRWSTYGDWIILLGREESGPSFAMQPLGPRRRNKVVFSVLSWLRDVEGVPGPSIERADGRLAAELREESGFTIEAVRDHFDYVYLREDLALLGGNRYRAKRNHINKVTRSYAFEYEPLEEKHLDACLDLQSKWCVLRRCDEDLSLLGEWEAIREIAANFRTFDLKGGVITIDGKVEAFSIGELLNDTTAVVHIEKANPEMGELYTLINQQFAEKGWRDIPYVNREQDLGIPGLREAKLSYHPDHMVEKYRITLAR